MSRQAVRRNCVVDVETATIEQRCRRLRSGLRAANTTSHCPSGS
jgi:hypothetical protein